MTSTFVSPTTPRTRLRAEQLIAASERQTHDPFREVDWTLPIDDSAFHLPPEVLALHGTPIWDSMSETERMTYSRHEAAALFAAGIWFENALMQIVLRHLVDIDVKDPIHRYLLIEVADECRHSAMFGEYIRRAGTPSYAPCRPVVIDETDSGRALSYLLILAIEEMLDHVNKATMRDDRVHEITRQISRLHVLEEARHVSFAKSYLGEVWPTLDHEQQATDVFDQLGISDGADAARSNPQHRATVVAGLSKLTSFLREIGIIDPTDTRWAELGLVRSADRRG